jgi:hypothetical protein
VEQSTPTDFTLKGTLRFTSPTVAQVVPIYRPYAPGFEYTLTMTDTVSPANHMQFRGVASGGTGDQMLQTLIEFPASLIDANARFHLGTVDKKKYVPFQFTASYRPNTTRLGILLGAIGLFLSALLTLSKYPKIFVKN